MRAWLAARDPDDDEPQTGGAATSADIVVLDPEPTGQEAQAEPEKGHTGFGRTVAQRQGARRRPSVEGREGYSG